MRTLLQERRKFPRLECAPHLSVSVLRPRESIAAENVNLSEGGICVRLQETLEVRSLVRLQVTSAKEGAINELRPVECTGRVAWVIQRLDLRNNPPFLFDIGIEFVDPPPILRRFLAQRASIPMPLGTQLPQEKVLATAIIRGRQYAPRLEREQKNQLRWHLIVTVEGMPCFSGRYPSERAARDAWEQFKRKQSRH